MGKITIFVWVGIAVILIGTMGYLSYSEIEDEEHDHSVEIEGKDMKLLTIQEIANLWEIDSIEFLSRIITQFNLEGNYQVDTLLEDIREEYAFSPAMIKDLAEAIKQGELQNQ
jgi:hypothetical protein